MRRETRLTSFGDEPEEAPVAAAEPEPRAVAEVLALVNGALDRDAVLRDVWVKGEVSGFKEAPSGHWYFDLKDEYAVLPVVVWRSTAVRIPFRPEEGLQILVRGAAIVYAARGKLQLVATDLRSASAKGDLALRFEQLKKKLAAEGLFALDRKRPIPTHPRRIGVVTSLAGAAVRDIIRVASERHSGVALLVANARVQGDGAALEIAAAIRRFARTDCDVIIVGRGGGSAEDLWAFNEEAVVRAVAASPIPVVSAVGHETDFTLCDLAADVRAATPSQAAEMCVPDAEALLDALDEAESRMIAVLDRLVPDLGQRVDDLLDRAVAAMRGTLAREHELLAVSTAHLDALSPLATLARGYAVARRDGRALRSVEGVAPGDDLEVVLRDGAIDATVKRTRKEDRS